MCSVCGSTNTRISNVEIFEYKGQKIEINCTRVCCRNCGESVADDETVKRIETILRDAKRTIDVKFIL